MSAGALPLDQKRRELCLLPGAGELLGDGTGVPGG